MREVRGVGVERGVPTALDRIDVGACYTRGARSRPIYIPGNMYLVCA